MKKKKIFFVIESLVAAGAEKSLVTFLSVLSKEQYEIDLQLFAYGGEFERYLPEEVNLLPPLDYTTFLEKSIWSQLISLDFCKLIARCRYSLAIRKKNLIHKDRARLFWKYVSGCIPKSEKKYDIAVAYAHDVPTLYVVDKISARQKFAWVNVRYVPEGINRIFYERYYSQIDHIVAVSESAFQEFAGVYPNFSKKMMVIKDMLDGDLIKKQSMCPQERKYQEGFPALLTVARLNKPQKGYDITLEACKILKDRNVKFKWYALGCGEYRSEMDTFISKHHLEDYFIFLGTSSNPYPYIRNCMLYVQTSRHEGFGLSIAEARILNKPVVTTEFDAVWAQMVQGDNGLVVPQNPVAVADAIERVLNDKKLYDHIVAYQKQEKKGNTEEIQKFYQLVENL